MATNIPVLLMTAFVLQGHIFFYISKYLEWYVSKYVNRFELYFVWNKCILNI